MSITELCTVVPAWDMTNDEWLEARQWGIGGSEIGALAGLSKYESPTSIWARKVHNARVDQSDNEAIALGHLLESSVALQYARDHNAAVVEWPVILRSKMYDFLSANVDRFIVEPSEQFPAGEMTVWKNVEPPANIICLLECKTGALASPGSPQDWFRDGESIPDTYACQGYWYLAATGLPRIEYACLLGGYGMQYRTMQRDDTIIANLLGIASHFWNTYVLPGVPPDIDGSDATEEALKALYPRSTPDKVVDGGAELALLWNDFENAKAETKKAEDKQRALRSKIVAIMGDAELGLANGEPVCTFKSSKDGEYFAEAIFKEDDPETWARYIRTRAGHRTLRGKK